RDFHVTGVQTCALPILSSAFFPVRKKCVESFVGQRMRCELFNYLKGNCRNVRTGEGAIDDVHRASDRSGEHFGFESVVAVYLQELGRASCRARKETASL